MPKPALDALTIGTVGSDERAWLKQLFVNARSARYTRFVEPCAGAFAMSQLAREAGYPAGAIETSDVTLFTTAFGYGVMNQDCSALRVACPTYDGIDLADPAVVLWAQLACRFRSKAGTIYFDALLEDLEDRRDEHIARIREQIERASKALGQIRYTPMDLRDHLETAWEDEHAIVSINPPTYKGGYEKFFDTRNLITWAEPKYGVFDPVEDLRALMARAETAKCLLLCYQERPIGEAFGTPIFARANCRAGWHAYYCSNRTDEAKRLATAAGYTKQDGHRLCRARALGVLMDTAQITVAIDAASDTLVSALRNGGGNLPQYGSAASTILSVGRERVLFDRQHLETVCEYVRAELSNQARYQMYLAKGRTPWTSEELAKLDTLAQQWANSVRAAFN